ncbi:MULTISPECIES: hypothetical protein [Vibrio]|uniref:hypothetical protein n=1 Tax=Vibrio TaxID=662 RepID=UPI000C81E657|nr:hypothetical protein [Vibrio cyclitrophicus]PMF23800.1 hypothetical protein BCV18_18490 [Vibrio cyclitrophicus]
MADKDKRYFKKHRDKILEKRKVTYKERQDRKNFNELIAEFATAKQLETAKYLHILLPEFGIKADYMVLLYREHERSKSEMDFKQWLVERLKNAD